MTEEWRTVQMSPIYEVSDLGRVRNSGTGKILKTSPDRKGYLMCSIRMPDRTHKTAKVHRLVCEAWHGPPEPWQKETRHLDDCKTNNRPYNLRWGTTTENQADRLRNGRSRRHLTQEAVDQLRKEYWNLRQINKIAPKGWIQTKADLHNIKRSLLVQILIGKGYNGWERKTGRKHRSLTKEIVEQLKLDHEKAKAGMKKTPNNWLINKAKELGTPKGTLASILHHSRYSK